MDVGATFWALQQGYGLRLASIEEPVRAQVSRVQILRLLSVSYPRTYTV